MKAVQISRTGSFDVLEYVDMETPSPGSGQVLIKVFSASVNFVDVMVRKGTYPMMMALPTIPGVECSGIVESVGENVTTIRPGQHVVVFGQRCYAEYVVADVASVTPIPDSIDRDEAAALPVNYLTAYHMLNTMAQVPKGQTILVYAAAGGVGTAMIQLAKLAGVTVVGLTSSDEKAQYAREQGSDYIINYKTENVLQRIREITNGKGVNIIFNSVAGNTFNRDFEALAPLGQIIWFGLAAGPPKGDLGEQLAANFGKSAGIRTFTIYSIAELDPELMSQSFETLLKHLMEKKIKPHIHERIPLSETARAHKLLETGSVMGKLILRP